MWVHSGAHLGVGGPHAALFDGNAALVQVLCLLVAAHCLQEHCQVVHACRHLGMICPKSCLPHVQHLPANAIHSS